MTVIPIQLSDVDLKKIDYLIKLGRYKNRSQAIKEILKEKLAQETSMQDFETLEEEEKRKKIVQELSKVSKFEFSIKSKKSAAEIISEERERY